MSLVIKMTSKLNDNLVAILGVCLEITSVQYCLNKSFKIRSFAVEIMNIHLQSKWQSKVLFCE